MTETRILLLEDDPDDAQLTECTLRIGGLSFSLHHVGTKAEFVNQLVKTTPDLILSDYGLPDGFDGFQALEIAQKICPDVPFIVVSGTLGEELAIDSLKRGATDYVLKSRLSRLAPSVHRALRERSERVERKRAEEKLAATNQQLLALTAYLQSAREEERTRVARDLQCELGQALSRLKVEMAWVIAHTPPDLNHDLLKITEMSREIDYLMRRVERIGASLKRNGLDHAPLVSVADVQAAAFGAGPKLAGLTATPCVGLASKSAVASKAIGCANL